MSIYKIYDLKFSTYCLFIIQFEFGQCTLHWVLNNNLEQNVNKKIKILNVLWKKGEREMGGCKKKIASKLAVSQACFSFGDNIVHNLTSETVANRLEVITNYEKSQ